MLHKSRTFLLSSRTTHNKTQEVQVRNMQHRWIELSPIRFFGAEEDVDDDDKSADPQAGAEGDGKGKKVEDKFSAEYVADLRKEAAGHRVKGKEETDRADKAEAELAKIKQAEMSDLEASEDKLKEAKSKSKEYKAGEAAARSALRTERIRNAVTMAAFEAKFEDPTDALSMISQDDLVDDEGNIIQKTVKARLDKLAKKKPYLLKTHRPGSGDGGGSGIPEIDDTFDGRVAAALKDMTSTGGRVVVGS